jgi:hypothetical protein
MYIVLHDEFERLPVEDVGRVHDLRRVNVLAWLEANHKGSVNFTGANAVDETAVPADQIADRDIRAGFLCESNDIELFQLANSRDDSRGVIDVEGSLKSAGQCSNGLAGNFRQQSAVGKHSKRCSSHRRLHNWFIGIEEPA